MENLAARRSWIRLSATVLGLAVVTAAYLLVSRHRERHEVSRLWSRLAVCVLGDAPLGSESIAARLLALRRAADALGEKDNGWPSRCQRFARALAEAKPAQEHARGLATEAAAMAEVLERRKLTPELWARAARAAESAGLSQLAAASDVPRPPPGLRPMAQFVPLADAPRGTRVGLDARSFDAPEVLVHSKPPLLCRLDVAGLDATCSAPAAATRHRVEGRIFEEGRPLADGSTLALVEPPATGLDYAPNAKLVRLESNGASTDLAAPELARRSKVGIAGEWVFWVEENRIVARRLDPATGKLSPAMDIAPSEPDLERVDSCARREGQVVVLGRRGEPSNTARDTAVVLFETPRALELARIADVHLFHDPDPVFERALVRCDDGGVWLTWSTRERSFEVVRCTPAGCKRASWGALHAPVQNARVVELAGKPFLILSRHEPSAILMRSGAIERMTEAPESCLVESAHVQDVLALGDSAIILARSDEERSRTGAFRLDASGKIEALTLASSR